MQLRAYDDKDSGAKLSGRLSGVKDGVDVVAVASPWSAFYPATAFEGTYRIGLEVEDKKMSARNLSASRGSLELTISSNGQARITGSMAGQKSFLWSGRLAADGSLPIHVPLGPGESLSGSLQIVPGERTLRGSLIWVTPSAETFLRPVGNPVPLTGPGAGSFFDWASIFSEKFIPALARSSFLSHCSPYCTARLPIIYWHLSRKTPVDFMLFPIISERSRPGDV